MLTAATKNAIIFLRELKTEPITVKHVSEKHNISYDFLQQISLKLRRAGLTRSVRGPGGGIVKKEESISLLVVHDLMSTAQQCDDCPLEGLVRNKMAEINVLA